MKLFILNIILVALATGCGDTKFSKLEPRPNQNIEDSVIDHLKNNAKNNAQCHDEMTTLIENNKSELKNFVAQLKMLPSKTTPGLPDSNEDYFKQQLKKILSPDFKDALIELSSTLEAIANDDDLINSLKTVHSEIMLESGDRFSELLMAVTQSPYAGTAILEAVKKHLECDTFDPANALEASLNLLSETKEIVLGNLGYLLGNTNLFEDGKKIIKGVELIKNAKKIQQFLPVTTGDNLKFICELENLKTYQNHIKLLNTLLTKNSKDPKAPRPLRALLNMSLKLFTMNKETNNCLGRSFDDLKKEDLKANLLMIADYLVSEKSGLLSIINAMKPRT
ncbi:MAG: hypothetical protein WCK49_00230 [Myxococcaceae bacterium]